MDKLIGKIKATQNPSVVGLDTHLDYLPESMRKGVDSLAGAAEAILNFNKKLIDAVADEIPAVKIQIAYYEMYGTPGLTAFAETAQYAREKGLYVIADAKRNDIGATAQCYANAFLGSTTVGESSLNAFYADSLTVNGYLGTDGIAPFTNACKENGKTIFVLVKTSNPSSGELQDLRLENGKLVYQQMADSVAEWGKGSIGKEGYSAVGAVVGATYPAQGADLRARLPHTFFLIPGYGAQGGAAADLAGCFDARGLGGIVNASRSVLCAYKKADYAGLNAFEAARAEVINMKKAITGALKEAGKWA